MSSETLAVLRDAFVLTYMLVLRVAVPLLTIFLVGRWIRRRMVETDLREQRARMGEPYCWDIRHNAHTAQAKFAAAAHPDLPCWLAVQSQGGGVTDACFNCPRYAVNTTLRAGDALEVR